MTERTASLEAQALEAYGAGRYAAAIELFEGARASAAADPEKSAELANSLCVVLLKDSQNQAALEAVSGTPQVFAASGDLARQARATGNLASALEACGQLEAAEAAYREAAKLFESTGDEEERLHTLNSLSQLQLRQRRPFDAAATLQAVGSAGRPSGLRARLMSLLLRLPSRLLRS